MGKKHFYCLTGVLTVLLVMCSVALTTGYAYAKKRPKALTISTTPAGSTLAVYGVGVAKILERHLGISTAPEACKGSLPSMMVMLHGDSELSAVTAPEYYYGYFEKPPFKKGTAQIIRGLFFGEYASMAHWIVRSDSDIRSIKDLKNRRVMCNRPGQALYQDNWKTVLEAYGMNEKDIVAMPALGHRGAVEALKEKRCEAFFHYSSAPGPAFTELSLSTPIRLLSVGAKEAGYVIDKIKWLGPTTIAADTYKGQTEPTRVLKSNAGIMVRADLADDLVYKIAKVVHENFDELKKIHPSFKKWTFERLVNGPLCPYHAGAFKYYTEKGLLTKDSIDKHKAMLAQMGQTK